MLDLGEFGRPENLGPATLGTFCNADGYTGSSTASCSQLDDASSTVPWIHGSSEVTACFELVEHVVQCLFRLAEFGREIASSLRGAQQEHKNCVLTWREIRKT